VTEERTGGRLNSENVVRKQNKAAITIAIRLRFDVANKKAVAGAYDVIVYVAVIRMAFTLTDQHRLHPSIDCPRWYLPFHTLAK